MRAGPIAAVLLLASVGASAASIREGEAAPGIPATPMVAPLPPELDLSLTPLAPASAAAVQPPLASAGDFQAAALVPLLPQARIAQPAQTVQAPQPADFTQRVQQLSASAVEAARQAQQLADDAGRDAASRQFALLTGERQASAQDDEPTQDDVKASRLAVILRNPTLPPRVANVIEREMGLKASDPLFVYISKYGTQARNSHTNEPLGQPHEPVNPVGVIAGLFNLRENSRAYYDSLKNAKTGVVATGVRGGVDAMVDSILEKGYLPPRSQGRNLRFLNGVYMDLPNYIHEARKFATVEQERAEGKDRYPMFLAFRAGNVHNPGTDYEGRIVGDGGTLGQVALDPVRPSDVVSIYVPRARLAQAAERLKDTALAHVQVYPMDILPAH